MPGYKNYNLVLDMALKDVAEYIRDAIAITYENKSIPVFTEKSITYLYNNRLMYHGSQYNSIDAAASAWNTHATWMREKIQEKIPGFCIAKKGREVTLNIDDEVGQVLYAACIWPNEEQNHSLHNHNHSLLQNIICYYKQK